MRQQKDADLRGEIRGASPGPESRRAGIGLVKFLLEVAARREREKRSERTGNDESLDAAAGVDEVDSKASEPAVGGLHSSKH
jgi:hypothetical protein